MSEYRWLRCAVRLLCCAVFFTVLATAQAPAPPIAYTVSLTSLEQHLLQVQIMLPPGAAQRELQLPVWNALYQVRDFSQYINWIHAKDRAGHPLAIRELDKSRWQIQSAEGGAVVDYQIYVDSPGPFGAQLNTHHAFFNLAQILMYSIDARTAPIHIHLSQVPAGWKIATPLTSTSSTDFDAPDYDRLVDSPLEISN